MKIDTQSIPSELNDAYILALRPSQQWWYVKFGQFKFKQRKFGTGPGVYVARGRGPFRLPHLQGLGPNTPSGAQLLVRKAFKKCITCFEKQPDTGGVTPPALGARARTWWYSAAASSGLWYFNYFIQKTWPGFYGGTAPDWCLCTGLQAAQIAWGSAGDPDLNYHPEDYIIIRTNHDDDANETGASHGLFKRDAGFDDWTTMRIYVYGFGATIQIYNIDPDSLDVTTVTWNTRPTYLSKIAQYVVNTTGWIYVTLPPNKAIAVVAYANIHGSTDFIGFIGGSWFSPDYYNDLWKARISP